MELQQVRKELGQLERDLKDRITKFEELTQVAIRDISLQRQATWGGAECVVWVFADAKITPDRTGKQETPTS